MKLAFTTLGCPDWTLDQMIAGATEYGFDGIDFRGCAGEMDLWKLPAFGTDLQQTAASIRDAGLAVPCMSSSGRLLRDSDEERAASMENLARFVEIGAALGARFVRVFGGYNEDRTEDEARAEAARTLDEMARVAAPHGMAVLVETHDDWIASDKLASLLDAAAEPNVGAIWDINHPYRMCGETPEQTWAHLGRRVRYTHVKDSSVAEDGERVHALIGDGDVPIADCVRVMKAGGYDGWLAYEWEKKWAPEIPEPEVAFPRYVERLRAILARVG
ncbi:MAG: sugar phosphate isomerase/epimerase family protein [Planctomycetota bacterium]